MSDQRTTIKAKLIVDVVYDVGPEVSDKDIERHLLYIPQHAAGVGAFTDGLDAEVEEWDATVELPAANAPATRTVWTLLLSHDHGKDVTVHATEEEARSALFDFVQEWWDREITSRTMPTDRDKAIRLYFDLVDQEDMVIQSHTIPA